MYIVRAKATALCSRYLYYPSIHINPYCRLLESSPHGLFRGSPIHVIVWVANCPRLVELIEIMVQLSALLLFIFLLVPVLLLIESFGTPSVYSSFSGTQTISEVISVNYARLKSSAIVQPALAAPQHTSIHSFQASPIPNSSHDPP